MKGDCGGQGPSGSQGPAGKRGAVGSEGPTGKIGGPSGEKGDRGWEGQPGLQGLVGDQGERGERGQRSDASDVLSVLATHLPNQLAERYGEKMCFVKYHVSEDESSVVRMTVGVQTLRNISAYKNTNNFRAWTLFGDKNYSVP